MNIARSHQAASPVMAARKAPHMKGHFFRNSKRSTRIRRSPDGATDRENSATANGVRPSGAIDAESRRGTDWEPVNGRPPFAFWSIRRPRT